MRFGAHLFERNRLKGLPGEIKQRITRALLTGAAAFRTKRLIVFLTPGYELIAGGVISIANIYRESANLQQIHGAKVVLCTIPGDPFFFKYTWFENTNCVLDLEQVLKLCGRLDYLQLHIPEYTVNRVADWLERASPSLRRKVRELDLNVMLQNLEAVNGQNVGGLKLFGRVTCTTAHEAYSNASIREALGVSLHRLGTCNGPELYPLIGYEKREQLLIVSSDPHPLRDDVLRQIGKQLPELKIKVIENLAYKDYVNLTLRAKWALTFGEGLDGYFVDPIFSGGVSFAVFNDRYFTPAFAELENIYPSWEVLIDRIVADMRRLDEPVTYKRCWRQAYDLLSTLYNTERFRENLRMFYRGEYTFP